ncbi:MAG TPA: pyrroline-5-carboxylate reductase [Cyanobacteria bacterium UBA8530]|nr:pyrroline-5-carboxylate reductase [Cyanobacteria bacterium UBA8530]
MQSLSFLGGGIVAEALMKGILSKGLYKPEQILVSDPLESRREHLARTYEVGVTSNNLDCLAAEAVLFAIKPAQLGTVLSEVKGQWSKSVLALTVVAGARLEQFGNALGQGVPVIRAMPNTPCIIGQGIAAITGNEWVDAAHLGRAREIFSAVGKVLELPEDYFDAVTGLSGSGPAYIALIIEGLIEAGVHQGLPRRISRELVCQTMVGTSLLVQQSGAHPAELKDQVVTPAGTTAAGLQVLEEAALRATLCLAVSAATKRSKSLGAKRSS